MDQRSVYPLSPIASHSCAFLSLCSKNLHTNNIELRTPNISTFGFMKIISYNVNGIRSAERKGLARWLARIEPWDVVCLQEIRAAAELVPKSMQAPRKSRAVFHPADRKGYSGVALYAHRAARIRTGFGSREFAVSQVLDRLQKSMLDEISRISSGQP